MRKTCRLTNTFCFIDENSAINDNGIFKKRFKQTYLEELELEKENLSNPNSSFLDIEIGVTEPFSVPNSPYSFLERHYNLGKNFLLVFLARHNSDHFIFIMLDNKLLYRMRK